MNHLHKATTAHYHAKRLEALAILDVYFNSTAGIGEHSDLLEEITKWVEILANAEDCLDTLNVNFNDGTIK
jgi:hypothetical protein|tara:strand:+ start:321 stop:533 length:213 start_codon:yes stop_codon:yes gene_type:complete